MNHRVVTVFGGSGFIGRHLIWRLAKTGVRIRVATRSPEKAAFLRPAGDPGQVVPVRCDIRDEASVAAALVGADAAINLVGILAESGKQSFDAVHHQAAARIARCAARAGVKRVVHMSALGASSASPSAYARSKAAGEAAVLDAFPAATIVRPSVVFGPEDEFFNRFGSMARWSPFLPLVGGGATKFQPVYVGDVADAILEIQARPETRGKTYELGGPRVYSFRELMKLTLRETGRRRALLSLPFGLAHAQGAILERLPGKLLTRDQVELLKTDNVVSPRALTLADLGVKPTAAEMVIPSYLERYRVRGRFARLGA